MAKSRIPDPLARRHLVEGDIDPARALVIADAYLAEDRTVEAVAFLQRADAHERLAELVERAVETGDAFLLRTASDALGRDPTREQWQRTADAADAAGKELYAQTARRQANVEPGPS